MSFFELSCRPKVILATIVFWLFFACGFEGCTHLTVAPKPVNAHAIAFDKNVQSAGIIDCDSNGCQVTKNWVAKYRQLETEFKQTFSGDVNIKSEGDHYRAPYDCIEFFTRLKTMERGQ